MPTFLITGVAGSTESQSREFAVPANCVDAPALSLKRKDPGSSLTEVSVAREAFAYKVIVPFADGLSPAAGWQKQGLRAKR